MNVFALFDYRLAIKQIGHIFHTVCQAETSDGWSAIIVTEVSVFSVRYFL